LGAGLNDVAIIYEDSRDADAWERFISSLEAKLSESPVYKPAVTIPETPEGVMPTGMRWDIVHLLRRGSAVLVTALVVMVGVVSFIAWHMYVPVRQGNLASIEKMAFPLPDKPSIAVLPFVN
jgi:hypothetical protein